MGATAFMCREMRAAFWWTAGKWRTRRMTPYPHLSQAQIQDADTVFLTHSHADHSGALPWLYANGFCGRVIAAAETLRQLPLRRAKRLRTRDALPGRGRAGAKPVGAMVHRSGFAGTCRVEGFCRSSRAESRPGVQSLEIRFSRCRRRNGPSEAIGGGGLRPAGGRSADDAAGGGRAAPCFFRKDAFFRIFEYLCRR